MMTAPELTTCRNLLDMLQDCNGEVADYWGRMLEHIDWQSSQIATLKVALISERNRYLVDFIHEYDDVRDCKEEANEQLAQEYPEIDWEE